MSSTLLQAGAQSATFKTPAVSSVGDIPYGNLTIIDWHRLPSGKLKSVLSQSYTGIGAFAAEWALSGGVVNLGYTRRYGDPGYDPDVMLVQSMEFAFVLDSSGYPILYQYHYLDPDSYCFFRIQTSYSASE